MLNIRRINVRHRGPMESEKHDRFYRALRQAIDELQMTYQGFEQTLNDERHQLLHRQQGEDVILYQPLQQTKMNGLGITYPYDEHHPLIERVGVITTSKRQPGGFDFKGSNRTYHADRIFYLDELFSGSKETLIPAKDLPTETKLEQELDEALQLLKGGVL